MSGFRFSAGVQPGALDDPEYRKSRSDLVIVRRDEPGVYAYLSMRLRGLAAVELKLDERQDPGERRADDRRSPRRRFNAFGVQVVRGVAAKP